LFLSSSPCPAFFARSPRLSVTVIIIKIDDDGSLLA
jgi:hypothetical protein